MNWKYILLGVMFIALILIYIDIANFTPKEDVVLERIDKLELKIDSLNKTKDSIRTIIDSTYVKIITNEKHYQERINTILIQSASADSSFITDYIRLYSEQNSLFNSK
jgi:hypothetical protein